VEERLVQLVAHLRAEGVRVSLAESIDAGRALAALPALAPDWVKASLRATLIKEQPDQPIFERLYSLYFAAQAAPSYSIDSLSPEQTKVLTEAITSDDAWLQRLAAGEALPFELLAETAAAVRSQPRWGPVTPGRLERALEQALGLADMPDRLHELRAELAAAGLSEEDITAVAAHLAQNGQAQAAQSRRFMQHTQTHPPIPRSAAETDLLRQPFTRLSEPQTHELRRLVQRLGRQLRAQAARRYQTGHRGRLDVKATVRASVQRGGVPFELHFRTRKMRPRFTLLCDLSTSVRPVAGFMLQLVYAMQDQLGRVHSFAYNDRLVDISDAFLNQRPELAIPAVLARIPPGHYATDLGQALADFWLRYPASADRQTSLIILGDGRNNSRSPRLDLLEQLQRRVRRLVWFNPTLSKSCAGLFAKCRRCG
jgi:uncharacterized protein with von Willebrand factor type A (vWA) domain